MIRATVNTDELVGRARAIASELGLPAEKAVKQAYRDILADTERGIRENTGKPRVSIVLEARHAIAGVAGVLTHGSEKYSRANWRKGLMHTEVCDSLSRHLVAYLAGEDYDPETGLFHVDHVLANALFLAELTRTRPDLDDRPKFEDAEPGAGYAFPLADREGD